MSPFDVVLGSVVPVLLMVAAGYLYSRVRSLDAGTLVDFVIEIGVPCLVLAEVTTSPPRGQDVLLVVAGNFTVVWGVVGLTALAFRGGLTRSRSAFMTAPFANAVNIPVPLALFAFGPAAVTGQLLYAISNMSLMYLAGIWMVVGGREGLRRVLRLPPVWALAAGLLLAAGEVQLPDFVLTPLRTVGDTVVPVLLFALGCQLSSLGRPRLREALVPVLLRMAGGAAAGLLFVLLASPSQAVARTVLLGCSMPPAIQTYVLCARVDADPGIAASGVVLGTLVAAVTIPVLVPLIVLYI